jgi:O-antigen/teichoic acid export membrane protein
MLGKIKKNSFDNLKSEFFRNALTLISGTTIAQFIAIIVSPILSRIYSTEDFGELSLFMSITGILSVVATLRYEMAVILPKKEEDAINIMALSFLIALAWSFLSFFALFLFGDLMIDFFGGTKNVGYIYLVPLVVLLLGLIQILNFWSLRIKNFKRNAMSRIGNTTANNGLSLGIGLSVKGSFGLITGYFVAQVVSFLILVVNVYKKRKSILSQINWKKIKSNAYKYRNFPKINASHALVGSFQENGIIFFMKSFFGTSVLGSYSFAYRLLSVPSSLISASISQVLMEKATRSLNNGVSIKPTVLKIYKVVFLLGAPLFLILFLFAPDIFAFIFSEKFREAGVIAQILTPWMFLNFIANSASGLPIVYNRLGTPFLFTCIDIVLKIVSLIIGWYFHSYHIGFLVMSISCSILLLITFVWIFSLISNSELNHYDE